MDNQDFKTVFTVAATATEVFNAVNHVRGWWSENIEGDTDRLGGEFTYHYQDVHRCRMRIIEWVSNKKVVWQVLDNYFNFTKDSHEWTGTYIHFDISERNGETLLKFTHQGLVPTEECYQVCRDAWTHYIQGSLKQQILTGKGNPTPKDTEETHLGQSLLEQTDSPEQTSMKSICHRLLIEAPAETIYGALTTQEGLAGWWTPETLAKPEVGSILRFAFGPDYFKKMQVVELKPYSKVRWLCLQAFDEWIGTTLAFELEPHAKGSVLSFRHGGWAAYTKEFASCSYDWALFFRSLKFFCETGSGFPYPDFNK